ncbi:MAG TPA: CHAT domain-containing protein [Pirellulales bacterium]|nr:CHAT domain-containing protein [Pirellulales bacterium]
MALATVWSLADGNRASAQVKPPAAQAPSNQAAAPAGQGLPQQVNVVTVPAPAYFAALTLYQTGQFREAAAALSMLVTAPNRFSRTQQQMRQQVTARIGPIGNPAIYQRYMPAGRMPIEDICYFTMRGECNYQLGAYAAALLDYQAALGVHLSQPNWLEGITIPRVLQAAVTPAAPWGQRGTAPGDFPATVTVGGLTTFLRQSSPNQFRAPATTVYVQEIVRCTCLAIYRWHELVGPLREYHPFITALRDQIRRQPRLFNPWAQVWLQVESGMIAALEGKTAAATAKLQQAALFGELDHPLTGYALLMLGRLSRDKPDVAEDCFLQASLAAAHYNDLTLVQEALRSAAELHLSGGRQAKFAPLETAIVWASTAGSPPLEAALLLLAAEDDCRLGEIDSATARLAAATAIITPSEMATGRIGARLNYLNALVAYRRGNALVGEPALQAAIAYQRLGSFWQFRAGMLELASYMKVVPDHRAAELYAELFHELTQTDWLSDPLESLSQLVIPHAPSYERWLELPVVQHQNKLAFEVAERTRRHRFLSTLDLGGRMQALRWVLEAPQAAISKTALDERPQIQIRAPRYAEVSHRSRELITELRKLPLLPSEPDDVKRQKKLFAELKQTSAEQEMMLRQLALERQDCEMVFPPLKSTEQTQAELGEGQAIWSFLETSNHIHAFLLTREGVNAWQLDVSPSQVAARIRELLQHWGNPAANRPLTHRELADDRWQTTAQQLFQDLTKGGKPDFAAIKELIIVPDGELWYLPFELLLTPDDSTKPLITRVQIRYSPTAGLAVGDTRPHRPGVAAVVPAKALSQEQREAESERLSKLEQSVPDAVALHSKLHVDPALLSTLIDQLIVYHDVHVAGDAYHWPPIPLDAKDAVGGLAEWMALPWGGPDQMLFLGYHPPAERRHKGPAPVQPPNDLFLSICGLMAAGSRTVLISRWRTGGQTNDDLLRQFAEELPGATAAEAWQRAVQTITASPLVVAKEPRLKLEHSATDLSASHPFFWAGPLLADTGSPPRDK